MTQPHSQPYTQTYTPAEALFAALTGFCRAGRTGVFRIVTHNNHAAAVGLEAGRVVALRYRIRRGAEALPLLGQIEAGQYSFNEGESLSEDPGLPGSGEILAKLGRRDAPNPPTRPADAVFPPNAPTAVPLEPAPREPVPPAAAPPLSPATRAMLEAALAEHIGPMAGIIVRNTLAKTSDLGEVVAAIRAKIPSADRARQFEEEVRRKLA